jgi:predicted P-loop ATPase
MSATVVAFDGGRPPSGPRPPSPPDDWRADLTRSKEGNVQATLSNLFAIIENDEALAGLFGLDEFANRVALHRTPPWLGSHGGEFRERDASELAGWLGNPFGYRMVVKSSLVLEAVETIARRHRFHPVRDYLHGLEWDGTPRMRRLFIDHCGVEDTEYHQRVAEILLLSAAARILRPGCKVDTMLVLEGRQGLGKTRVTQVLFGGDRWYMDAQRSPAEKDFYQDIVGKWGVEIGEMTSFTKAEANKVKQTLSATSDTYRPSYARYSDTFPRQCVFVGTTNEDAWQRDHTGGRRFLPVHVQRVDVDAIAAVRDQLWAEAVHALAQGANWWELPKEAAKQQDDRYQEDAWLQPISEWLAGKYGKPAYENVHCHPTTGEVLECTSSDVLWRALKIDTARHTKQDQMRVGAIFQRMEWPKYRPQRYGARLWTYYRPDAPEATDPTGGTSSAPA